MAQLCRVLICSNYQARLKPLSPKITLNVLNLQGILSKTPIRYVVHNQKVQNTYKITEVPPNEQPFEHKLHPTIRTAYLVAGGLLFVGSFFVAKSFFPPSQKDIENLTKAQDIKIPPDSSTIPKEVPYLLIGGGTASFSAFRALKIKDPTAKVLLVTNEPYLPYMRPPLSKDMWYQPDLEIDSLKYKQWNGADRSLLFECEEFFINLDKLLEEPKGGIACIRGWTVTKIDADKKIAFLDDGSEIKFNKCLIATGVRPKNLPVFENAPAEVKDKVTLFRSVDDFKNLHKLLKNQVKSVLIVGGSFLGSELACALSRNNESGIKVTQVFPEKGNLGKFLPAYLSTWVMEKVREQGIQIIPGVDVQVASLSSDGKQVEVILTNGKKVSSDHVIVAVGSEPNVDLAASSQLEVNPELGGYVVNSELSTRTDIYAAGDCACFHDPLLGRRRVEHHDHAVVSGRLAGENMVGGHQAFNHQSYFWTELGPDILCDAVGIIDSSLPTVAVFAKTSENNSVNEESSSESDSAIKTSSPKEGDDYSRGVIFYLKDDIIVGIIMWNLGFRLGLARRILKEKKKYEDLNEVAKLFAIHEEE